MVTEQDVQKLEAEIEHLRQLVYYDELTGAFNRRGFLQESQRFFSQVAAKPPEGSQRRVLLLPMSVIFLDVDNFKFVNDTFGHDIGDGVLKTVTELLPKYFRSTDVIGRWGGEEFVVALYGASASVAAGHAERVRKALHETHIKAGDRVLAVTASFGVAEYTNETDFATLVDRADKAMYQAKQSGKDRVIIYGESPQAKLISTVE